MSIRAASTFMEFWALLTQPACTEEMAVSPTPPSRKSCLILELRLLLLALNCLWLRLHASWAQAGHQGLLLTVMVRSLCPLELNRPRNRGHV